MPSGRRLPHTEARRAGFTLIELMVAVGLTAVIAYVAFGTLTFGVGVACREQSRAEVQAELSNVIDQLTKELRETVTQNDGVGGSTCYGITVPAAASGSADVVRHLNDVLMSWSPVPPLQGSQQYVLNTLKPLLEFYTYDVDPTDLTPQSPSLPLVKHRIRYGLSIPGTDALARRSWPLPAYQPLQVTYANDWYNRSTGSWVTGTPQPVTGQVVTDFVVIRPAGTQNVVQLVLEASIVSASGTGVTPIRMVALVTLPQ
jgi:prepilin-type N-terminal cleavage/methylation domain-containing protein